MLYATFTIGDRRYVNYPITDMTIDKKFIVIQIDGFKHLNIPCDRCEYILEVHHGKITKEFNIYRYLCDEI